MLFSFTIFRHTAGCLIFGTSKGVSTPLTGVSTPYPPLLHALNPNQVSGMPEPIIRVLAPEILVQTKFKNFDSNIIPKIMHASI